MGSLQMVRLHVVTDQSSQTNGAVDGQNPAPGGSATIIVIVSYGCGSKIGTQNATLLNGNMDENLWVPGSILNHTHISPVVPGVDLVRHRLTFL